jgi:hypothetical protein
MKTELLTAEDVSNLTGLSLETLAQWRSRKKNIPYLKIGGIVRYSQKDIQVYLDACRVSVSERRQIRVFMKEEVCTIANLFTEVSGTEKSPG